MSYFKKVKVNDKIFGLVFGPGKVKTVFGEGHYTFEVEFKNGYTVPYTEDGIPGWGSKLDFQTIFYKNDIDIFEYDFTPTEEILSAKKIISLRLKKKLEIRCPSGLWQPSYKCPSDILEDYLESGKLHLFRKGN